MKEKSGERAHAAVRTEKCSLAGGRWRLLGPEDSSGGMVRAESTCTGY